jgi:hypothetical protein
VSGLWRKLVPVVALLGAVRAQAATVVVVRPASASPALTETMSRLRGELLSLGHEVVIAERPAISGQGPVDPRAWLQRDAGGRAPDAVIDIVGDRAPAAADIWIFEGESRRAEVSRVVFEQTVDGDPGQLAIHAVEVLRSRLLAIDLAARARSELVVTREPAAVGGTDTRGSSATPAGHVDLEAGAAMLTSLDGVGPALLPMVRVGWATRPWLLLHATVAGLGSRPDVTSTSGTARVAQQYAMLGGCICGPSARPIGLTVALSAGALRTTIDGQADAPAQGHFIERWSLVVDGSVGARLNLPGRYHLTMAAHVQVAEPYVAIYFMDNRVATTGRPNLLVSLTVGAWL